MPGPIPSYAIILTHNRPELLDRCVRAVAPQVDQVIVVDNASDPHTAPPLLDGLRPNMVIVDPTQPPNLSALWNQAFDWAAEDIDAEYGSTGSEQWDLVMLCDDADVPPGWVRPLLDGMRVHNAIAACTLPHIGAPILKTEPDRDIMHRMPGWAFALAGEAGLRADERIHWWWCDTHLDWMARKAGGMVALPGPWVVNSRDNEYTNTKPELGEQAGRDGQMFEQIHGWRPW